MSRRHWRTLIALAVVMVIGSVGRIAMAHGLNVFAAVDGQSISGRAYFAGGGPAKRLNIQILAPDGSEIAQTQTDGGLVFQSRWPQGETGRRPTPCGAHILSVLGQGSGGMLA